MGRESPFDWSPDAPSRLFYQTGARRPLLERGEGVYLYARDGRRWLDGSSGAMVSNIGHSHPHVLAAMRAQMAKATFGYRLHFENEPAERLAAAIASLAPGLDRVFFTSGGSETVESCLKLARQYAIATGETRRTRIISRHPSYHGSTFGALAVTGYDPLTAPFAPMLAASAKIPAPRAYLDRDNLDDAARGLRYADMLEEKIAELGPETVLAFVMEPVGGASTGALVAPDSYYPRIADICRRHGVLLIYDEVMSGAGRTGAFLAAEHWGVAPDIVALAKGLGAGYAPLGAMLARADIADAVVAGGGFMHGYTYAGNPLACAAGVATLQVILEQDLAANCAAMGARLRAGLEGLGLPVTGAGLILAAHLGQPAGPVITRIRENEVLVCPSGAEAIRFLPPFIVDEGAVDEVLAAVGAALQG